MRAVHFIASLALAGCSNPSGLLDFCDGVDDDGDGTIDEGEGAEVGCPAEQRCVEARCGYLCGDRTCNPGESCASCPGDCGRCDECGDTRCTGEENCASCPEDCFECPTLCDLCAPGFTDCDDELECRPRACDGAPACHVPATGDSCETVGTHACGEVVAWDRCLTHEECGNYLRCIPYTGEARCVRQGENGAEASCPSTIWCPPPPHFGDERDIGLRAECEVYFSEGPLNYDYVCVLRCSEYCPYGLWCVEGTCVDA